MTLEEFEQYQEQSFDSFCKSLIQNESIDIFRMLKNRSAEEVAMSTVSYDDLAKLRTEDTYQTYERIFDVRGKKVKVNDWALGQALQRLNPQRRDVILLYYFLEHTEPEIGELLDLSTGMINYRRTKALQRLKELLEELE